MTTSKVRVIIFDGKVFLTLLSLFGLFSTFLNFFQVLNGFICFSRLQTSVSTSDSAISQFSISGFGHNHLWSLSSFCERNESDVYPFCDFEKGYLVCKQNITITKVKYRYSMSFNCSLPNFNSGLTFGVQISPGSASLYGSNGNQSNYHTTVESYTETCGLNSKFYFLFSIFSSIFIILTIILRFLLRINFSGLTEVIYLRLNPIYKVLDSLQFFDFCCAKNNAPDFIFNGDTYLDLTIAEADEIEFKKSLISLSSNYNWNFCFKEGGNSYRVWEKDSVINFLVFDNLGLEEYSCPISLKAFTIREYVLGRSSGLHCIEKGRGHNLSLTELVACLEENSVLRYRTWVGESMTILGRWSPPNPKLSSKEEIINHCYRFFGFYSNNLVEVALSGRLQKPDLPLIKNTEWKIYLSDLYFHLGQKLDSKTKKFGKSKSLLSSGEFIKNIKTDLKVDALIGLTKFSPRSLEKPKTEDERILNFKTKEEDEKYCLKSLKSDDPEINLERILNPELKWQKGYNFVLNEESLNSLEWAKRNDRKDLLMDRLCWIPNLNFASEIDLSFSCLSKEDSEKLDDLSEKMKTSPLFKPYNRLEGKEEELMSELERKSKSAEEARKEIEFRFYGKPLEKKLKSWRRDWDLEKAGIEKRISEAKVEGELMRRVSMEDYNELKSFAAPDSPVLKIWEIASGVSKGEPGVGRKLKKPVKKPRIKLKDHFLSETKALKKTPDMKVLQPYVLKSLENCDKEKRIPGVRSIKVEIDGFNYHLPGFFKRAYKRTARRAGKSNCEGRISSSKKENSFYSFLMITIMALSILSRNGIIESGQRNEKISEKLLRLVENTRIINKTLMGLIKEDLGVEQGNEEGISSHKISEI